MNRDMYIQRHELESDLLLALNGSLHILIHGESGCGKSWLYKKVLTDADAFYLSANLANASRLGSITNEMANVVARRQEAQKTGYTETKSAELDIGLAMGRLAHEGEYKIPTKEPLEACLELARREAGIVIGCF